MENNSLFSMQFESAMSGMMMQLMEKMMERLEARLAAKEENQTSAVESDPNVGGGFDPTGAASGYTG